MIILSLTKILCLNLWIGSILDTEWYLQFNICKVNGGFICSFFMELPTWTTVVTLLQQAHCELWLSWLFIAGRQVASGNPKASKWEFPRGSCRLLWQEDDEAANHSSSGCLSPASCCSPQSTSSSRQVSVRMLGSVQTALRRNECDDWIKSDRQRLRMATMMMMLEGSAVEGMVTDYWCQRGREQARHWPQMHVMHSIVKCNTQMQVIHSIVPCATPQCNALDHTMWRIMYYVTLTRHLDSTTTLHFQCSHVILPLKCIRNITLQCTGLGCITIQILFS